MTEHARQPAGQPTGGQFAPTTGSDAGVDLAPHRQPIVLEPGEEHVFPGPDDTDVMHYEVYRDETSGRYLTTAYVSSYVSISRLLTDDEPDPDECEIIEQNALTVIHHRVIEDILTERYGADIDPGADGEVLAFNLGDDNDASDEPPTEEQVADRFESRVARWQNESDPGTFGSPYLGTILRERLNQVAPFDTGGIVFGRSAESDLAGLAELDQADRDGKALTDAQARFAVQALTHGEHERSLAGLAARTWDARTWDEVRADLERIGADIRPSLAKWLDGRPTIEERIATARKEAQDA